MFSRIGLVWKVEESIINFDAVVVIFYRNVSDSVSLERRESINEEVRRDFLDLRRLSKKVVDKQINDGKGNFLQFLGYLL